MEYKKYLEHSWQQLCEIARKGEFSPNQEQDVVCMLYRLCLDRLTNDFHEKAPLYIHSYHNWNFDIVLGKLKGQNRKTQEFSHCLLAEVKFISKRARKNRRLKYGRKDVEKLSSAGDSTARRVFAIFDKPSCLGSDEIDELKNHAKEKHVTVLYGPKNLLY